MMISLIIPTKDRLSLLKQTLTYAQKALASFEHEIIIVNDSEEGLKLTNEILSPEARVVKNPGQGVASARNYGASSARGKWLLFLDDDMLIQANNIQEVFSLAEQQPKACYNINWEYPATLKQKLPASQFGRFLNHYGFTSFEGWHKNGHWNSEKVFSVETVTSQFLFIRKDIFFGFDGYNENFPFAGFEDYDLARRLKQHQITIFIHPTTMAYHNEADRSVVDQWLARRKRGGETRQVAVRMGYSELTLHYGRLKSGLYQMVLFKKQLLLKALNWVPNIEALDRVYFFLVNLLYGAYVYEGYHEQ